jgi:hypothetical protein
VTYRYDFAQICENGHVINRGAGRYPQANKAFCDQCGKKTITECPHCNGKIRGELIDSGVITLGGSRIAPDFCLHCGKPYPWTEAKCNAAIEMANILSLNELEAFLQERISDLIVETPQTKVAAVKLQQLFKSVPGEARIPFRELLVEILSQSAKKIIYPDVK